MNQPTQQGGYVHRSPEIPPYPPSADPTHGIAETRICGEKVKPECGAFSILLHDPVTKGEYKIEVSDAYALVEVTYPELYTQKHEGENETADKYVVKHKPATGGTAVLFADLCQIGVDVAVEFHERLDDADFCEAFGLDEYKVSNEACSVHLDFGGAYFHFTVAGGYKEVREKMQPLFEAWMRKIASEPS